MSLAVFSLWQLRRFHYGSWAISAMALEAEEAGGEVAQDGVGAGGVEGERGGERESFLLR